MKIQAVERGHRLERHGGRWYGKLTYKDSGRHRVHWQGIFSGQPVTCPHDTQKMKMLMRLMRRPEPKRDMTKVKPSGCPTCCLTHTRPRLSADTAWRFGGFWKSTDTQTHKSGLICLYNFRYTRVNLNNSIPDINQSDKVLLKQGGLWRRDYVYLFICWRLITPSTD